MIILICTACLEVVKLSSDQERGCPCGKTFGQIEDGTYRVSPYALPVGITNSSLMRARRLRKNDGWGSNVEAVVLPRSHFKLDHSGLLESAQLEALDEPDA